MITNVKFFIVLVCSIIFIAGCGEDSSGGGSYRLIDTLGNTLEEVKPPANTANYKTIKIANDYSGGAAALASILNYLFGHSISESDAIEGLMLSGSYGQIQPSTFSFYAMQLYAASLNHQSNGYTYENLCSYENFDSDEISTVLGAALLPIRIDGYGHYAVLQGYDENYVYFSSPLVGKICVSYAVFCAINFRREVFVVWPDGVDPLTKGGRVSFGTFRQFL